MLRFQRLNERYTIAHLLVIIAAFSYAANNDLITRVCLVIAMLFIIYDYWINGEYKKKIEEIDDEENEE
jgi:hypothetical protein